MNSTLKVVYGRDFKIQTGNFLANAMGVGKGEVGGGLTSKIRVGGIVALYFYSAMYKTSNSPEKSSQIKMIANMERCTVHCTVPAKFCK